MSVSLEEINQKLGALPEKAKNRVVHTIDNHSQTSINLSHCKLQAKDMFVIADLLNLFPRVTMLDVGWNNIGDKGACVLAANKTITTLDVDGNELGDKGATALAGNKTITTLNVLGNKIGLEGVTALAANKTITTLNVSFNAIGDKGARVLAGNKTITTLDVGYNAIGYEGARALAANKTITTLNVKGNHTSETSVCFFSCIKGRSLEEGRALIKEMLLRNIKLKKSEAEIRKTARILAQARRTQSGSPFFTDSPDDLLAKIAGYRGDRDLHSELDSNQMGLQYLDRPQNKATTQLEKKSSSLSSHWIERINQHIEILNREIDSFWPYPNKDRKQIKVNALQSLLDKCNEGQNVSEAINEVQEAYPQVMAGRISQRTATLLNDIARDTTNTSAPTVSCVFA